MAKKAISVPEGYTVVYLPVINYMGRSYTQDFVPLPKEYKGTRYAKAIRNLSDLSMDEQKKFLEIYKELRDAVESIRGISERCN